MQIAETNRKIQIPDGIAVTDLERKLCCSDLKYLCREILDMKDWDICHDDLESWYKVNSARRYKLVLMPRSHLKTSILTIGKTIQDILINPDVKILIASAVWNNSRAMLSEIKEYLMTKSVLPRLFGWFQSKKWTTEEIIINQRQRADKTPTIDTSGIDKVLTSHHYDIIRADDLVTRENVTTKDQIDKVIAHFRDLLKLLSPGGALEIIGSRWHDADLYSYILKELSGDKIDDFSCYRRAAIENGKVIFPKKFSDEKLADLRSKLGTYEFASNYLEECVSAESQHFKPPIRYWTDLGMTPAHTITVDLAISEEQDADYTVVMDTARIGSGQLCVVEYARGRFTPKETLDKIFEFVLKFKAKRVGIESVAYQKALCYLLEDERKKRGMNFETIPISQTRDKFMRVMALQPLWESGNLLLRQGMNELEEEMLRFPVSEHDDLCDALAMSLQMPFASALKSKIYIPSVWK